MADKKISALTSATTPLAGTEVLPIVQSGATVKVAISDVTAGRNVSMAKLGVGTTPSGTRFFDILSSNAASQEIGSILASSLNDSAYVDVLLGKTTANDRCAFTRFTNGTGVGDSKYQIGIYGQPTPAFDVSYNGNVAVNTGNLVIGTSGKGIDFSATPGTGTSELLDDYEEGTWTPVLTFATPGDLAVTYNANQQTGTYTIIGDRIVITFAVETASFTYTTASGNLQLTGLPYTAKLVSGIQNIGSTVFGGITKVGYTQVVPRVNSNTILIDFTASGSGVAQSMVASADVPTTSSVVLRGTLVYQL